ncbi:MAG: diguanylate cyclase [Pseudomonadota bacterium]
MTTEHNPGTEPMRIENFETEAAMQLVQAFHAQLQIDPLLGLFYRQAEALAGISGLTYERAGGSGQRSFDCDLGTRRRHSATYNLQWTQADLGCLVVYFERPAAEHALSTVEDLVALMAGALKNALALADRELERGASPAPTVQQTNERAAMSEALASEHKQDSLVLIAIDDFDTLRERSGDAWAQAVIDSVQALLRETLRQADGVYQIRTGLLAALLPRTSARQAAQVAEKLRVLIGALHLSSDEVDGQLTACMGIATSRRNDNARSVLGRAEDALKLAQLTGAGNISAGRLQLVRG